MAYILNIYEKGIYIYSNITYKGKLYLKIKKTKYYIHHNICKAISKNKFNLNRLNAISVNLGPGLSDTRNRNILSSAKGFCYALNIPLIKINNILLFYIKYKKTINKNSNPQFLIFINNNQLVFKYNHILKKFFFIKKTKRLTEFIFSEKKNIFFINSAYKKIYQNIYKNVIFYKINYNYIIKISYYFYLKRKYVKNINKCLTLLFY